MKLGSSLRRRRRAPRPGPSQDRLRLMGLGLGLAVVGFGLGFLIATQILFPAPEVPEDLVEVPGVLGLELASAEQRVSDLGLVLAGVDSVRHPAVPAGQVLGQSPLPGQRLVPAGSVLVTVSRGPQRRAVPDVSRVRGTEALAVLRATGFEVEVDSVQNELPRGSVVRVEPPPGTDVAVPAQVTLQVSLGPPRVEMPLLRGLDEERARAVLDSLGLVISDVETRFRFGTDPDVVLEQDPRAGALVEPGSAVRLVVARRGG